MCACGGRGCGSCRAKRTWTGWTPAAAPPPPGPPPAPAADAGQGGLSIQDLGYLRMAGSWGLLRAQSKRRFMLTGVFSMPMRDLAKLIEAAGGLVEPDADILGGTVDVLVTGEDANPLAVGRARESYVPVWDEAELVLELLPLPGALQAPPGVPPF